MKPLRALFVLLIARSSALAEAPKSAIDGVPVNYSSAGCGAGLEIDLSWQWANMPEVVMKGLKTAIAPETEVGQLRNWDAGFNIIAGRQHQSARVLQAYKDCMGESQHQHREFFSGVVGAARDAVWDRAGVLANLQWQATHNRGSIDAAKAQLARQSYKGSVGFMYYLMYGQRQSPGVMAAYRAAYRSDNQWLINTLSSL